MLHVERRQHIDAGSQHVFDILPALDVTTTGDVGVRQLVDQCQRGPPCDQRIQIELCKQLPPILHLATGQLLQPFELRFGLDAAVGLYPCHHDIDPAHFRGSGSPQHVVGLADTG